MKIKTSILIFALAISTSLQADLFEKVGTIVNPYGNPSFLSLMTDDGIQMDTTEAVKEEIATFHFQRVYVIGEWSPGYEGIPRIYNIIDIRLYQDGDENLNAIQNMEDPSLVEYVGEFKDLFNTNEYLHFVNKDNFEKIQTSHEVRQDVLDYQFREVYVKGLICPGFENQPMFYKVIDIRPSSEKPMISPRNRVKKAPAKAEASSPILGMLKKSSSQNGGYYIALSNRQSIALPSSLTIGRERELEALLNKKASVELIIDTDGFRVVFK